MPEQSKIVIAGVGGQGVVFLTRLIVAAATAANIPVATSEVHGLAQRGGSVSAGITLGYHTWGFIEHGGADLLLGLEPLEAQRYASFLNSGSTAVINNNKVLPYSVNSGLVEYPDIAKFIDYLQQHIEKVIYIADAGDGITTIQANLFLLGRTCSETDFMLEPDSITLAITQLSKTGEEAANLDVFNSGLNQFNTQQRAIN